MTTDLAVRDADPSDYPRMAALSLLAWPFAPDSAEARERRYRDSASLFRARRYIVERLGRPVGQFATLPFDGWMGGQPTRIGGLASVAVAPEARRTGVARTIVRAHLEQLRAAGYGWAMLYPFAPSFYARFGWAPCAHRARWRFAPSELPCFPERREVIPLRLDEPGTADAVAAAYRRHGQRVNGAIARTAEQIAFAYRGAQRFLVGVPNGAGGLAGYLLGEWRAATPRPQALVVSELIALEPRAQRALLGVLAAQADQADWIELDTPLDDPIATLLDRRLPREELSRFPEEHQLAGEIFAGAMMRVVDLDAALVGRGWPSGASATISFAARDPELRENEAERTLLLDGGPPRVVPGRAPSAPLLRGAIGPLTRLLTGAARLRPLLALGELTLEPGAHAVDEAELEARIALPPPYPLVTF